MGRGDRRTKKGKITRGSHGNCRPKTKNIKPTEVKATKETKEATKES